jgi:sterol desaturase/sphingolipid hydroxylase (fatty acid hydroxylase superfamily)
MKTNRNPAGAFGGALNYYVAMAIDLAAALAFLGLGVLRFTGHPGVAAGAALLGFLSFGFLEYAVHRWVLHGPPSIARRGHQHHHAEPRALVATPFFVAAIASIAIWRLLCLVSPAGAAALFVFGLYAGYNNFALFHHWVHHHRSRVGFSSYWRRLDRFHHAHHQRQGSNFGVSMMMWDGIFGTFRPGSDRSKGSSSNRTAPVPLL